ncbi:hypothetical protein HYV57_04225, partial [Candidatus Peregrinibacteria bacterium]|nr:hypothetical protein [Candidatus Peregrinibacteria bacterium]
SSLKDHSSVLGGIGGDNKYSTYGYVGQVGTLFFLDVPNKNLEISNGTSFFQNDDIVSLSNTQAFFSGNLTFGDSNTSHTLNWKVLYDGANSTTKFNNITIKKDAYVTTPLLSRSDADMFDLTIDYSGTFTIETPTSPDGSCRSFPLGITQDTSFDTCFIAENLTLIGPSLDVQSNTHISLDGYGYAGGAKEKNGSGTSPGIYQSNSGGGGGHAGKGGNSSKGASGGSTIYGSTLAPSSPGSGGGGGYGSSASVGGNGGGVIRLDIKNTTTINGLVSANGLNAYDYYYTGGGGAGGSIFITTDTLLGSGSLSAQGGRGGNTNNYYNVGGGGSGGYITYCLYANKFSGNYLYAGGAGGTSSSGTSGGKGDDGIVTQQNCVPPDTAALEAEKGDCVSISGFTATIDPKNSGQIDFSKLQDKPYRTCIDWNYNKDFAPTNPANWVFDIHGWSYNDNLGWVSFSCRDWDIIDGVEKTKDGDGNVTTNKVCEQTKTPTPSSSDYLPYQDFGYKTVIDFYGYLHGYAWSTKVGWIQFDWDVVKNDGTSCAGKYGTSGCPSKDGYYNSFSSANIPAGRVYDDYSGKNANTCTDSSGASKDTNSGDCPPIHGTTSDVSALCGFTSTDKEYNPACIDSGGRGHMYGYAWNPTVGWFDMQDSWGIEDDFCDTTKTDAADFYHYDSEQCGVIWVPYNFTLEVDVSRPDETGDSVFADGYDQLTIKAIADNSVFEDQGIYPVSIEVLGLDPYNNLQADQIDDPGDSSDDPKSPKPIDSNAAKLVTEVPARDVKSSALFTEIDTSGVYEASLYTIFSVAPTSAAKGYDANKDGVIDIYYDTDYTKFQYAIDSDSISFGTLQLGLGGGVEISLPINNVIIRRADASTNRYYFKFEPAVNLKGISNDGNHFITTWRNHNTYFDIDAEKTAQNTLSGVGFDFTLSGAGMNYSGGNYADNYTTYHFVFDSHQDSNNDGTREIGGDDLFDYSIDTPELSLTNVNVDTFVNKNDLLAVPLLNPTYGGLDEVPVTDPSLKVPKVTYSLRNPKDNNSVTILYVGDTLGAAEGIYNPVANVKGFTSLTLKAINTQTGESYEHVGDIQTNLVRDTIARNVRSIIREQTIQDGGCAIDDDSNNSGDFWVEGGTCSSGSTFLNDTVYYFEKGGSSSGDVILKDSESDNVLEWPTQKTIIVNGGNLFIDSNIWSTNAQTGIIVLKDAAGNGGNIYIHPNVTYIKAQIFADGVMTSYDGIYKNNAQKWITIGADTKTYPVPTTKNWECVDKNNNSGPANLEEVLHNQLLIRGALTSANTIGGSDKTTSSGTLAPQIGTGEMLPASEDGIAVAKLYDLNFLRYFKQYYKRNILDQPLDAECKNSDGTESLYYGGESGGKSLYYDSNGILYAGVTTGICYGNLDNDLFVRTDPTFTNLPCGNDTIVPSSILPTTEHNPPPGFESAGQTPASSQINR